jgi:hypothetical protein
MLNTAVAGRSMFDFQILPALAQMLKDDQILELSLPPYGSFPIGSFRKVTLPVRRITYVSSNSQGECGGAVYGVGDKNYFVGNEYRPATRKDVERLDYYLDYVQEVLGVPSKLWNEQPNTSPISDASILDALEQYIISINHPQAGRGIFIHRDHEVYEVTPQGKVRVPQRQRKPDVA